MPLLRAAGVAALLGSGCEAAQLALKADGRREGCVGAECLELVDYVQSASFCADESSDVTSRYRFMKCGAGNKAYSISCARGRRGCSVSYEDPQTVLQASIPDSSSQQKDLLSIMRRTGTDKVTQHHYSPMYQKWAGHLSHNNSEPFTFLEVGFAMGYSARAWAMFFPSADVHEMEVSCDEDWNRGSTSPGSRGHPTGPHRDLGYCRLHCGDATKEDFLEESLAGVKHAPYVVVDDGGHGAEEMRLFFKHMWPKLRPGGMFFVEDLAESYGVPGGFMETTAKPLMKDLMGLGSSIPELSADLESMECREQICVFQKKAQQ